MGELTAQEITEILDLADKLKAEKKAGKTHHLLAGKKLGMIFQKASTRTRVSFEAGMYELGGLAMFFSAKDMQLGRGEPIKDTARVLSRYLDAIMIRTYAHSDVEDFAKYGTIPIINGLTDYAHPCQVLADLQTIRERKGKLKGLKLAFVGDGNNMANSLIVGCLKMGMKVAIACPDEYRPDAKIVATATKSPDFLLTSSIKDAVNGADVVYTDVWASMGMEGEAEKRAHAFKDYQVNKTTMSYAKSDALVLHCLPAHRGEEISEDVMEAHISEILDEAENRLHAQKAVLVKLLG